MNGDSDDDTEEEFDEEFDDALRIVGPSVVEVQSPNPRLAEKLLASPEFRRICADLEEKANKRLQHISVEAFLAWAVPISLDPPLEQLLSATERKRISEQIRKHTKGLRESLAEIKQLNGSPAYPFQPWLSRLSVHQAARDYLTWKEYEECDHRAIAHRVRFAIYRLLVNDLDEFFDTLEHASDMFENTPTKLHRPKNANARRLYFLRVMTGHFLRYLGSPCRKSTLALASIFFDCADLDEAALSKLAPVES